jgi:hypothetical protein
MCLSPGAIERVHTYIHVLCSVHEKLEGFHQGDCHAGCSVQMGKGGVRNSSPSGRSLPIMANVATTGSHRPALFMLELRR